MRIQDLKTSGRGLILTYFEFTVIYYSTQEKQENLKKKKKKKNHSCLYVCVY